jgi:hypothetical protein
VAPLGFTPQMQGATILPEGISHAPHDSDHETDCRYCNSSFDCHHPYRLRCTDEQGDGELAGTEL